MDKCLKECQNIFAKRGLVDSKEELNAVVEIVNHLMSDYKDIIKRLDAESHQHFADSKQHFADSKQLFSESKENREAIKDLEEQIENIRQEHCEEIKGLKMIILSYSKLFNP